MWRDQKSQEIRRVRYFLSSVFSDRTPGHGFVYFADNAAATAALKLDSTLWDASNEKGNKIEVKLSVRSLVSDKEKWNKRREMVRILEKKE